MRPLALHTPSVFQFLFRLAADIRVVTPVRILHRLVTGLANHYGASGCAIYARLDRDLRISADTDENIGRLSDESRARIRAVELRLVHAVHRKGKMVSALDIDIADEQTAQAIAELGVMDMFCFPLRSGAQMPGAVVLYLPPDSRSLSEKDQAALEAVGEFLGILQGLNAEARSNHEHVAAS